MLSMHSKENSMVSPWPRFFGVDDEEDDAEMSTDGDNVEDAQMSPEDMHVYKSCPVWEELILVKCRYCNSSILPNSIKNHVEMRHTGIQQYQKDPESSIFRKVVVVKKKSSFPTVLSSTLTPRASTAAYGIHGSRTPTSCSADAFSADNLSQQVTEQFLGWSNSPHGAFQQSPLNMTTSIVRVKTENSKMKVVIPPGYSGKMGTGVSILAKNHKSMLELSASIPEMKPEPYNQSFSFSSTPNIMPSTSAFASSRDMPSTSYEMPSTSYEMQSTSKGLFPCQTLPSNETDFEECMMYSTDLQSGSLENPQPKTPALKKIVLRRVLQTDPKAQAEGSQSDQGLTETNKKDSQGNYFMVVKNKDCKKDQASKSANLEKMKKMKRLKHERNKLINKLCLELQSVKNKLEQCNRSKQEIERQLSAVKADLEETKKTTESRNEVLLKKNAKFENEIQKLKLKNEELTTSLEQAQFYTHRLGNVWNFAGNHMSKQFQTVEEQKVELQRRIEDLESESRELKNSSVIERRRFNDKLKKYFKIVTELKRRYDEQVAKSQELKLQRDFYQKYLSPKICSTWRSKLAALKHRQDPDVHEVYPGLLTPQSTPPTASPTIPLPETLPVDTQNENYISFQSQLSPGSPEVFEEQQQEQPPQQEVIQDEEVS